MHSFSFVLEVRGPTKHHINRKRAYFGTSSAVPCAVYGTVRTRMIRATGTCYGSSYRMIPAAFHGHTLTGMRVPVLQNEDSSCSIRECNTSNTASTPNISDVCTAAAVDTACARGPPITYLVLVYQHEYVQGHCLSLETNVSVLA